MRRFEGRRVIVTGAASGIGRATVLRITAEGGSVAALDIDEGGLAETLKLVDAAGLVALFENPDFQGGKITVSSAANSKLTFRWTPNGTVFATPPVSDAEADKYTVRPSPYPVENRSTNQKYVTFNVLATEANKTLVKNETQTWFRKR